MNTSSPSFVKQNLVLIIGLTLPLLLIVLFFVATVLPKQFGTPPQYDLVYSTTRYDYQNPQEYQLKFFVEAGVLKARVAKLDKTNNYNNYNVDQLMVFNPKTESVQPLDMGKLDHLKDGAEIVIAATQSWKIDANTTAPDGYMFDTPSYRGGFMSGMFGGYHSSYRVKKGAVAYKVPNTYGDYYYNNVQFLGWVVEKK